MLVVLGMARDIQSGVMANTLHGLRAEVAVHAAFTYFQTYSLKRN